MMKTVFKRAVTLAICAVTVFCGIFACSGATKDYEIPQIDDMTLSMPDGMSAVTRDSKSTDKYFSVFGLDYDTTMKTFQNGNIYLQGMDNMSSVILTVTMTKNESSENVGNYAQLSSSELANIRNNFLNSDEYRSCTPDQKEKAVWLVFDATAQSSKGDVKTFVANTVYDGMNINITMQRTEGDVTTVDYDTFSQIVSSVKFSDLPFSKGFIPYIIIGGGVVILILIVLIIIFAVRIRKHKKAKKNNAILEELAVKYKLGEKGTDYDIDNFDDSPEKPDKRSKKKQKYAEEVEEEPALQGRRYAPEPIIENMEEPEEITSEYSNFGYDTDDAKEKEIDEIINSAKAYKSELEREAYKNNYGYEENSTEDEKKKEPTAADTSETEPEKIDENEKDNAETPEKHENISSSSGPTLVIPEPEHDLFETSEPDDIDREDDADVESRKMKLNGHVARLALLFQVMKWATDSGDMQYIERDSVESAIRMIDYYEETYRRIQETIVINSIGETKEAWLSLLEDRFTSGDAVIAGRKVDMSRRTVYYALDQLCRLKHPLIEKLQHGVYRKLMTENTDAPCTIALSSCQDTVQSSQSAKVQSATTLKSEDHE